MSSVETILVAAVEIDLLAEREAFVERSCAGDVALRQEVERLISNHFRAGSFLDTPAFDFVARVAGARDYEVPGKRIDCYLLCELLGEGGMGRVFVAEQDRPLRRKVALKIIKPGMDSREVITRFEVERQALALMDHPNIAKVLDAGTTDNGLPYFAMELVQGIPITEHCDSYKLGTRERLELFLQVCHAMQHAHQQGIIHRDLKPSNVMVTIHDATPVVKVIDFGVAKAVGQHLSDNTIFTAFNQLVGTPVYMSPEQADQSGHEIDARSDVYSLGVLLYQLLTGNTPFDKAALKRFGVEEFRRMIREVEPPQPSTRLNTLNAAEQSTIAECRRVEPRQLRQQLQGELDWIVMKALERLPDRRYASAYEFAEDIRAYLNDEPISARAPTLAWRLCKWSKLHPRTLAVIKASSFAACVLSIVTWTVWTVREAREARAMADSAPKHLEFVEDIQTAAGFIESGDLNSTKMVLDKYSSQSGSSYANHFVAGYLSGLISEPKPIQTFAGHRHEVLDMDLSPDGCWMASSDRGGDIVIWDRQTGRETRRLHPSENEVTRVRFCPTGELLASAGQDSLVRFWKTNDWSPAGELVLHDHTINGLDWSPDGTLIASGDRLGTVCIWNAKTCELLQTLPTHAEAVRCLKWSPDGKHLATADGNAGARVWSTETWTEVAFISSQGFGILAIAFSPDCQWMALGGYFRELVVVDMNSCKVTARIKTHDHISSLTFGENYEILAGEGTGHVQLFNYSWNTKVWKSIRLWPTDLATRTSSIRSVQFFTADGSEHIMMAAEKERLIAVIPKSALTGYDELRLDSYAVGIIADQLLVCADESETIIKSESHDGEITRLPLSIPYTSAPPAYSAKGERVAIVTLGGAVQLFRTGTWEKIGILHFPYPIWTMSFSRDGDQMVLAGGTLGSGLGGHVRVWDLEQETYRDLPRLPNDVTAALFSPSEDILIAGVAASRSLTCLNSKSLEEIRTIELSQWRKLYFHPRGDYLIVCQRGKFSVWKSDLSLQLWEGAVSSQDDEVDEVESVTILPDQQLMAILLHRGIVEFWDFRTRTRLCSASFPISDCYLQWLAFQNSTTLLVGSERNRSLFQLRTK